MCDDKVPVTYIVFYIRDYFYIITDFINRLVKLAVVADILFPPFSAKLFSDMIFVHSSTIELAHEPL